MILKRFLEWVKAKVAIYTTDRDSFLRFLELCLVIFWAILAGRPFLNLNPDSWPSGREFPFSIVANYFWHDFSTCGLCALWNGMELGGHPALLDLQGAPLHPLMALPTFFWGAVNGGKITIVLSMAITGLAQWWLARLLGVGRWARLWASLLAVVAGSLSGRMINGQVTSVVAIASASLVIPAGFNLATKGSLRAAIIFALALAQTLLAGQDFSLMALLLAILPMGLVYSLSNAQYPDRLRKMRLGIGLGVLLSAVYLVPQVVHGNKIDPQILPESLNVQPLEYLPVNLIIRDPEFFHSPQLKKAPDPGLYVNYIGWVPLLLAILALRVYWKEKRFVLLYLVGLIFLCFLAAALIPQRWIESILGITWFTFKRLPTLIATLALLPMLGLAALGLDWALAFGPMVTFGFVPGKEWKTTLSSILLIVPLFWSILSAYRFSALWIRMEDCPRNAKTILKVMTSPSTVWIQWPPNEPYWLVFAREADLKTADTFRGWNLRERTIPPAQVFARRPDETGPGEPVAVLENLVITRNPQVAYALLSFSEEPPLPCRATAYGGSIDVLCNHQKEGMLTVFEHFWPGWRAWIDGKPARLIEGEWLQLDVPPGEHQITFRYLPWDVPLGLALTLIGCGLAVRLWRKDSAREKPSPQVVEVSAQEHGCTQAEDGQDAAQHRGDD